MFKSEILDFCIYWLTRLGHMGILLSAAIGFIFCLVLAIRGNSFEFFLYGVGWVLLIFVAQYTAHKFLPAGKNLVKNNPSRISSQAFLDCFAFLALIGGVVVLIFSIVTAIRVESFDPFLWGLGVFAVLEFFSMVGFNAKVVTIEITESNSAGQEAIGIITFFVKAYMILVPVFFGIMIVVGTIMLLISLFGLFGSSWAFKYAQGEFYAMQILQGALLPFASYVVFALSYLFVDVIKAILAVPDKLDNLGNKQ